MPASHFLIDLIGNAYPLEFQLSIGRDPSCQIVLTDPEVSRLHASLWVEAGSVYIRDEGTANGTSLNGRRLTPRKATLLRPGSQVQIGSQVFSLDGPPGPTSNSRLLLIVLGAAACLCLALLAAGTFYLFLRKSGPAAGAAQTASFPALTLIATGQPPTGLSPADYSQSSSALAGAVTYLNTAERVLLLDLPNADAARLDGDLLELARRAQDVTSLAHSLARATAQLGETRAASSAADQYTSIERLGYVLIIQAQNLRERLPNGSITRAAAAGLISQYGAMLWNPEIKTLASAGVSFLPDDQLQFLGPQAVAQVSANRQMTFWLASTTEQVSLPVDLPGPAAINSQTVPPAADLNGSRQFAAQALIRLLSAQPVSGPFSLPVPVYRTVAISVPAQGAAARLPTFNTGLASLLARRSSSGAPVLIAARRAPAADAGTEQILSYVLNGGSVQPLPQPAEVVVNVQPAITLKIIGAKEISRSSTKPVLVAFEATLKWSSTYQAAQLSLGCSGGQAVRASGQSGSLVVIGSGYLLEGPSTVELLCRASRPSDFGQTMASDLVYVQVSGSQPGQFQADTDTPTPTPTLTPTPSLTPTATLQPTSTIDKTQDAADTEIVAQKTAEFLTTVTAIARQSQVATQASIISLNGTFNLSPAEDPCDVGPSTSGTLNMTANFGSGSASGTLSGGGSSQRSGLTCRGVTFDVACSGSYSGNFSGGLDQTSGGLSLHGTLSGTQSCTFSNCSQDGQTIDCGPNGSSAFPSVLTLTGTIIKDSGTGNGSISNCAACSGAWTAGK